MEPSVKQPDAARAAADRRTMRVMLWIFGFITLAGAAAFGFKLYEFAHDLVAEEGLRFAGAHLLTYVLVAGGFLLLLIFCYLRGHFTDIEQPKYDLLDQEREHDRRQLI